MNNLVPAQLRAVVPGGALTVLGIAATLALLLLVGISKALSGRRENAIVSTKAAAAAVASATSGAGQPTVIPDAMLATREDLAAFEAPKPDAEQFLRTMEAPAEQPHEEAPSIESMPATAEPDTGEGNLYDY